MILEGTVVSDKNNKTIQVLVISRIMHRVYKKIIKRFKKYAVHDELNRYKVGDVVKIQSSRPLSATKRWKVVYDEAVK